jgi:hypothetical protein
VIAAAALTGTMVFDAGVRLHAQRAPSDEQKNRNRYLLSYSPAGVSKDGWHRLDVRLRNRRGAVRARAGYQAGQ